MAIYIAINVAGAASPISVSALMGSALFGMFWPYFSTKRNLTFQGLRVGWVLVSMVRSAPRIVNIMKLQSISGLAVFDWVYGKLGTAIDLKAIELLTDLTKIEIGLTFWIFMTGFLVFFYSVVPYLFYRYFKAVGLFKRLPSF
jgi:hypothetical protein